MSQFSGLEIGRRALIAQRLGLEVVGNNIANVNTPGYSRQNAVLVETRPEDLGTLGQLGTGVAVQRIRIFREEYFDREIRNNLSRGSAFQTDDRALKRIEATITEPSENSLGTYIENFFKSWQELSLQPENVSKRELVLNEAENMAERFRQVDSSLKTLRDQTAESLRTNVTEINRILGQIAEINQQITPSKALGIDSTNSLVSQRAQRIEELSKLAGNVVVSIDPQGLANVSIAGATVVTGVALANLQVNETVSAAGERTIRVDVLNGFGTQSAVLTPDGGEIAAQLRQYNVLLDSADTSGGFSVAKDLSDLAGAIVRQVNTVARQGFGLDDTTAPNRNFFDPNTANSAAMRLDETMRGQPRNVPVASAPSLPGNNDIARQIARLADDANFFNNQSARDFYATTLTKVATLGADARQGMKVTGLVGDQLNAQRESVMGVNLDEEAVNLIKFQRAYEAAARVVNVTSEVLSTLVNIGR